MEVHNYNYPTTNKKSVLLLNTNKYKKKINKTHRTFAKELINKLITKQAIF